MHEAFVKEATDDLTSMMRKYGPFGKYLLDSNSKLAKLTAGAVFFGKTLNNISK